MAFTLPRVIKHLSPNRSSRRGAAIRASVIHTTESSDSSFDAINDYLSREGISASAHYVVDVAGPGKLCRVAMLVPEKEKAWTALSANPSTVNYELIGRASRSRDEWLTKYRKQLETVAALVAQDSVQYGFPVRRGYPGVLGHVDLSRYGFPQSHWDPGPGFPWDVFLQRVRFFVASAKAVPVVVKHVHVRVSRPADAPKLIPMWAWRMHKWHLTEPAKRGKRPSAPVKLEKWYWEWRAWRMGAQCPSPV